MSPLVLVALALAQPAKDPADGPAAKARKALDETAPVVSLNGASLPGIADYFKGRTGVEVQIDTPAVQAAGIDPNQLAVTATVRNAKYRDALRDVLAPHGLRFGVVGGAVLISTEEGVTLKQLRQRVTVDYAGVPLATVLKKLSADTGANLVLDPRQEEKAGTAAVKLALDDVPLETAVRLAADVAGLRAVRLNNVLYVTSDERAEKLRPDADGPTQPPPPQPAFPALPGGPGGPGGVVPPGFPGAPVPLPVPPAREEKKTPR